MDRELLDCEGIHERDERNFEENDTVVCQEQKALEEEKHHKEESSNQEEGKDEDEEEKENLGYVLWRTMEQYFPNFNEWLKNLRDGRDKELITYELPTLIWEGLLMFVCKKGSRRVIGDQMREDIFLENLKKYSGQEGLESVAHDDTLKYCYIRMNPDELEGVNGQMMRRLFRKKVFDRDKLFGRYHKIAIDGVYTGRYSYKATEDSLHRKEGEKMMWYHYKVVASLVTTNGMSMTLASEWVKNTDGKSKQDCEYNACLRLIKKLRVMYPKLPMCVLLDSLYCNERMFSALEEKRMEWMIVFKEGAMKEVYEWLMSFIEHGGKWEEYKEKTKKKIAVRNKRTHAERLRYTKPRYEKRDVEKEVEYKWAKQITHWNNKRRYNVLKAKVVNDGNLICNYTWLVSDKIIEYINRQTVKEAVDEGGRCRWIVENEGNNVQKNGGYNLEHAYIKDVIGMKIMHTLLEIAHNLNQLIEKGSLISKEIYGAVRDIAMYLFEHLRYKTFKKATNLRRIQIRLNWDSS